MLIQYKGESMKKSRRIYVTSMLAVMVVTFALAGCSSENSSSSTIVTTLYPVEFVTKQIVGDEFEVVNITPVGAEPHDAELTPSSTQQVLDAELVVVMGEGFQPAIEKTAESRDGATVELLHEENEQSVGEMNARTIEMTSGKDDHNEGDTHAGEEAHSHDNDPHIWLDPVEFAEAVEKILNAVIEIKPESQAAFEQRTQKLLADLSSLDEEFASALSNCEKDTFVTSHDAFPRLAVRYGLTQESIAGVSPENEPTPQRLTELAEIVREEDIEVIFTEELVSPRVAETLSSEVGVTTKVLSPIESLTQEQLDNGDDYFTLMRENLSQLSQALKCSNS
jgi:zinc transport system substrate-binding protein